MDQRCATWEGANRIKVVFPILAKSYQACKTEMNIWFSASADDDVGIFVRQIV